MREWIVAIVLYVFGIGVFRWLGGFAAAGDALREWGRATAASRKASSPSSS
ncbi:MAG TPA: hypothetical protein VGF23_16585 [Gaiellaceae bacterium]|jgi:hypothetical protein